MNRSLIFEGTGMPSPQFLFLKFLLGAIIAPVMCFILYGIARLIAMVLAKNMPDGRLKRLLLRDTETGILAYKTTAHIKLPDER